MIKRHKIITIASVFFLASCMVFAGGKKDSPKNALRIGSLNGPTGIPIAYMYNNPPAINKIQTVFYSFSTPSALLPKMIKGEVDIGFLPANVAAKVYHSNNGAIMVVGISDNGNLTLLTKDKNIKSLEDLKGKSVAVAGQGATPEYMFRYLLNAHSISVGADENSVYLDFSIPTANLAAELLSGKIKYAVVPEPFATVVMMRKQGVVRALDLQKEFKSVSSKNKTYPLTLMVVRKAYAEKHSEVIRQFEKLYKESCDWTLSNPQQAGVLVQKLTLGLMAPVVANSIPVSNFTFINASEARPSIENLLSIIDKFAPEAIGGKLPDDGFYFK